MSSPYRHAFAAERRDWRSRPVPPPGSYFAPPSGLRILARLGVGLAETRSSGTAAIVDRSPSPGGSADRLEASRKTERRLVGLETNAAWRIRFWNDQRPPFPWRKNALIRRRTRSRDSSTRPGSERLHAKSTYRAQASASTG